MGSRKSDFVVDRTGSRYVSRRTALTLALAGASSRALALDRPIASVTAAAERVLLNCDNTSVAVSSITSRLATLADFTTAASCAMLENSIEGPYFTCVSAAMGKNIVGRLSGQSLTVALRVLDANCSPVPNSVVDLWSCGPDGRYSGYDGSPDIRVAPGGGGRQEPTNAERFARGVLRADTDGIVEFDTIYPGFYAGRAIHIHFKVHIGNKSYLTNQAFLPEELNERILRIAPYNAPRPIKRVLNKDDTRLGNFPTYSVVERGARMLAVLNIGLPGS
jgi:protocatechuate 3,4-dioxygenase beta subunit